MKSLNILLNYTGPIGSGPVFTLELARGLISCHCTVYAVLSKNISNIDEWKSLLQESHLYFADTHTSKKDFFQKTFKFYSRGYKELYNKFKDIEFDYSVRTFHSYWDRFIDKRLNPKIIVTFCHDPIVHSGEPFIKKFLFTRLIKKSDEVVVLTKSFIPIVNQKYKIPLQHIHYIPHGRMDMYKRKQIKGSSFVDGDKLSKTVNYLFFGRIEKYKGLEILADAYEMLTNKYTDVSLTIAGSGNFTDYIGKYNKLEHVEIINKYIPDEEVGQYFSKPNTIVVLPYIDATQSGVIPIAFEYETPIIASRTGGLYEQLDNGKIGYLFETGNAEDLFFAMENFIKNPPIKDEQAKLMREYKDTLNWDNIAQLFLNNIYFKNKDDEENYEYSQFEGMQN